MKFDRLIQLLAIIIIATSIVDASTACGDVCTSITTTSGGALSEGNTNVLSYSTATAAQKISTSQFSLTGGNSIILFNKQDSLPPPSSPPPTVETM